MERGGAAEVPGILGRYLAVDEHGTGLRATWRPAHGFTNLSLWRGDECVETFHLSPEQMGELIAFLGSSLAAACPPRPVLRVVPPPVHPARPTGRTRAALARLLDAATTQVRRARRH